MNSSQIVVHESRDDVQGLERILILVIWVIIPYDRSDEGLKLIVTFRSLSWTELRESGTYPGHRYPRVRDSFNFLQGIVTLAIKCGENVNWFSLMLLRQAPPLSKIMAKLQFHRQMGDEVKCRNPVCETQCFDISITHQFQNAILSMLKPLN